MAKLAKVESDLESMSNIDGNAANFLRHKANELEASKEQALLQLEYESLIKKVTWLRGIVASSNARPPILKIIDKINDCFSFDDIQYINEVYSRENIDIPVNSTSKARDAFYTTKMVLHTLEKLNLE